mmetsp:Transcript_14115/g.26889  ORF Transcript_14115/g.26889 Transcript_14115/m.26889 type:complete len:293 (-) Transcript_14115:39-917(-)
MQKHLDLRLRVILWLSWISAPVERTAFRVRAKVPPIAPELAEEAVANRHRPFLGTHAGGAFAFRHGGRHEPRRTAAAGNVRVFLRQRHGVGRDGSLGQPVGIKGGDSAIASLPLGLDNAQNLLPGDIEADQRGFLFALCFAHRSTGHATLDIRRSRSAAHVNDATLLLVEEGNKGVAHALGPHDVDVEDDVRAHPMGEAGTGVVDDAVEGYGRESLGRSCHRFVFPDVHDHQLALALRILLQDLGNRSLALVRVARAKVHVASVFPHELRAQRKSNAGIASSYKDFLHDWLG